MLPYELPYGQYDLIETENSVSVGYKRPNPVAAVKSAKKPTDSKRAVCRADKKSGIQLFLFKSK